MQATLKVRPAALGDVMPSKKRTRSCSLISSSSAGTKVGNASVTGPGSTKSGKCWRKECPFVFVAWPSNTVWVLSVIPALPLSGQWYFLRMFSGGLHWQSSCFLFFKFTAVMTPKGVSSETTVVLLLLLPRPSSPWRQRGSTYSKLSGCSRNTMWLGSVKRNADQKALMWEALSPELCSPPTRSSGCFSSMYPIMSFGAM